MHEEFEKRKEELEQEFASIANQVAENEERLKQLRIRQYQLQGAYQELETMALRQPEQESDQPKKKDNAK